MERNHTAHDCNHGSAWPAVDLACTSAKLERQVVGLFREPFIAGIDTMIDKAVANIPNAEKGFRAIFSASLFPGANLKLDWRERGV